MYKRLYEIQTQIEYLTKDQLLEALANHKTDIEYFAYILHDKDKNEDGTLKKPHWHIMLKLYKSRRRSDVAKWFGLSESYVQDSRSGKYDDMLLYLIHENAPEKYQYKIEEVLSNYDYPLEISSPSERCCRVLLKPRKPLKIRQFIHAKAL